MAKTFHDGVIFERARVEAELDRYDITELVGGAIMLTPKVEKRCWKGKQHITGSVSEYVKRGCRCDACKKQMSDYMKERKAARKGN